MTTQQSKNCKESACSVHQDGKCLEGLELKDCPHFFWDEEYDEGELADEEMASSNRKKKLFSGRELSVDELTLVTNRYHAQIVIIIGDSDCGKTTLLGTLFDLLHMNNYKGYFFSGSLTQIGFEERSHFARATSNSKNPDTLKTNSREFGFLHLSLKRAPTDLHAHHLLLSDIGGEKFQDARDSSDVMSKLTILKHVHHVIYIIDGAKLADTSQRHQTLFSVDQFLQRAIDTGIFDSNTILKIAISKIDQLQTISSFDYEKSVFQKINKKHGVRLKNIIYFTIAVRPKTQFEKFELGFGLKELLDDWTEAKIYEEKDNAITDHKNVRHFNNFRIR